MHELTREQARRIAVGAQLLTADRPTDLLAMVRHLTLVQVEPTAAVAPSAEVVAWSRLGSAYRLGDLDAAVADGSLVQLEGMLRPAEDLALFRAEMAVWPGTGELREWQVAQQDWVEANDHCRRDILEKLYDEGPLPSSAFPDTTLVPWQSSGWNNDRNIRMLLKLMVRRGEVAAAGQEGREQLYDLAERVYPDVEPVPLEEARSTVRRRRLHSAGLMRARDTALPEEEAVTSSTGEAARVEGLRGRWRVDPAYLDGADEEPLAGRTVLLSPLDRLVFDRRRMAELFGFDYQLEMYKPADQRRWGYWAMPVLHHDRLVGKVDATAERDRGVLRVDAVHEDEPFGEELRAAVEHEIRALAGFLGLELG